VLDAAHPWLLAGALALVVPLTGWNTMRSHGANYLYARGRAAFDAEDYARAARELDVAQRIGPRASHAASAAFYRAASLLRMNEPARALEGYERVIAQYPDSIWVAESHYHVGLCLVQLGRPEEATARFRYVLERHPASVWARHAREQLAKLGPEPPAAHGSPGG
jgi:TolA-binding protein